MLGKARFFFWMALFSGLTGLTSAGTVQVVAWGDITVLTVTSRATVAGASQSDSPPPNSRVALDDHQTISVMSCPLGACLPPMIIA